MKWETRRLGDVADLNLGKMLDEKKNRGEPLPYLANINVRWGEFNLNDLREMRFEDSEKERFGLKYGDIVMCEGGEPGRCAIWKEPVHGMMYQKALHRIRPHEFLDSRFLFYTFLHKGRMDGFAGLFTGSTIKHLPAEKLAKVEIQFPKLPIQLRIADVLSNYDELMENNRRRMELLEESSRLLYREWFVRLRFPGHEHARLTNGLPQGWTKGIVGDFYDTASGGTPSRTKPEYFTGEIPWVKTQELLNGFITETQEYITEAGVKNSAAKLFPAQSVLVALYGATVGELGILAMPAATNQACCALFPKDSRAHYIHAFLFLLENKEKLVNLSAGAAQKNISQQIIRGYGMTMPAKPLLDSFIEALNPVFDQCLNLHRQNKKLRAARDLLLPRLMSGEVLV
jgi:type I restriction enzyme S subunit